MISFSFSSAVGFIIGVFLFGGMVGLAIKYYVMREMLDYCKERIFSQLSGVHDKIDLQSSAFLTRNEYWYYRWFQKCFPDESYLLLLPKVSLADVIGRDKIDDQVARMHVDFLVCRHWYNKELKVVAAVEIDDSSHDLPEVRARDKRKDDLLRNAGVTLYRIPAADRYDASAYPFVETC